ncbi:MAG: hypothetical protein WDN49_19015 [Acetobacteraceae bacterium]
MTDVNGAPPMLPPTDRLMDGFTTRRITTAGPRSMSRSPAKGPPLLLLHATR